MIHGIRFQQKHFQHSNMRKQQFEDVFPIKTAIAMLVSWRVGSRFTWFEGNTFGGSLSINQRKHHRVLTSG